MGLTLKDLPKTIKIGPHEIRFKIDPNLWLKDDKWGEADFRYRVISLAENIPPDRVLAIAVLHEVLHQIGNIYGAPEEHFNDCVLQRLDDGLLDFLIHNKELVKLLMEA